MTRALSVVIILILVSVATFALSGRASSDSQGLTYIALGDSVASGNAVPTPGVGPCQRDDDSYPMLVFNALNDGRDTAFHHLACSGARIVNDAEAIERCHAEIAATTSTTEMRRDDCELKSLRHQVSEAIPLIGERPALVTITASANDTSWTDPLAIVGLLLAPDEMFRTRIDEIAARIGEELETEVARLLAHNQVTVILTDYYNPLNARSSLYDLIQGAQAVAWGADNVDDEPCTGVDRDGNRHQMSCAERFEYALQAVNTSIASVAQTSQDRVFLASVIDAFRGHEAPAGACGNAEPANGVSWIRGLVDTRLITRPDCFHPNTRGAGAIASAVLAVWDANPG